MAPLRATPLQGIRVLDLSALGPGPFASMLLADFGADVLAISRPQTVEYDPAQGLKRGKRTLTVDLGEQRGRTLIGRLAQRADVLLESFRPGVLEKMGLGPKELMASNPKLIYARLTGWGQTGPYSARAGHDINYLAISGALGVSGLDAPNVPPALLGDLANGSYVALIGILMALHERHTSGTGRLIDAAITDGAAQMLSAIFGELQAGHWSGIRGAHVLSGNAPFYGVYQCADGKWFSVGAIEPKFYEALLNVLSLTDVDRSPAAQWGRQHWGALRSRMQQTFLQRDRDSWTAAFAGVDACGAPVLEVTELARDPHLAARGTVVATASGLRAAPAPRFSEQPGDRSAHAAAGVRDPREFLRDLGIEASDIEELVADGIIAY